MAKIRVKILTSLAGGVTLPAGWEGELEEDVALDLIQAKYAEMLETPNKPKEKATLPPAEKKQK